MNLNKKQEIIRGHLTCTCDEMYKNRKMADPSCFLCNYESKIELMMNEYLELQKKKLSITKEFIINRFKKACKSQENLIRRKNAVESQWNRDVWEIYDKEECLIRILDISEYQPHPKIMIWFSIKFNDKYCKSFETLISPFETELYQDEYEELKKIYFGGFKPNEEYLKHIGASVILIKKNKFIRFKKGENKL